MTLKDNSDGGDISANTTYLYDNSVAASINGGNSPVYIDGAASVSGELTTGSTLYWSSTGSIDSGTVQSIDIASGYTDPGVTVDSGYTSTAVSYTFTSPSWSTACQGLI